MDSIFINPTNACIVIMSNLVTFQILGRLGQENATEVLCKLCLAPFDFAISKEVSSGYNLKTLTHFENISLCEVH